ncbi:MAG: VOC family protein [Pseudomonadota bacterium]
MLTLDHLTVIAPTLALGASHVRDCLDLDVPFGTRHEYMGTHNHRLQLGGGVYLEIVALDPGGTAPARARWFGLDDQAKVGADWADGRRLRGWVASVAAMAPVLSAHGTIFGERVPLPPGDPSFDFAIPADGALPVDGAVPSLIDRRGALERMGDIPDLGATLLDFTLEHPDPASIGQLYERLSIDRPPGIAHGAALRYRAQVETPGGLKTLT